MSAATMNETPRVELDAESVDKPTPIRNLREAVKVFVKYPSPWLIFSTAFAATGMRLWLGDFGWWDLAIAVAIFAFWPVQEWLIHVFILHFKPFTVAGRRIDLHLASEHRKHHRKPWVVPKIFVPIRAVVVGVFLGIPLLLWILTSFIPMRLALTGLSVFFFFGSIYEWIHFLVHTAYKPKTRLYRKLWQNHRLHHFKNEHYWYGVTRTGADVLLRTAPDPDQTPKSVTVRTIV